MNNPNIINYASNEQEDSPDKAETNWDSLKEIPFAGGEKRSRSVKSELHEKISDFRHNFQGKPLSMQSFMFHLFDELQSVLSGRGSADLFDDYDFWRDALRELEPILKGFWPECDPIIIGYLFSLFVMEIMLLFRFWYATGCDDFCIKDCAILGEAYLGIGLIQKSMLTYLADRWKLLGTGRPQYYLTD